MIGLSKRRFCPPENGGCGAEIEPRARTCKECGYGQGRGERTYAHMTEPLRWRYEESIRTKRTTIEVMEVRAGICDHGWSNCWLCILRGDMPS